MKAEALPASAPVQSRAVLAKHARSFRLAALFLPAAQADDAAIAYAFCRLVDDIADESPDPAMARVRLDAVLRELEGEAPARPLLAAIRELIHRRDVPMEAARDLVAGVLSDLELVRIPDENTLDLYCYRVAGTVGLMMCGIMGVTSPDAREPAIALGKAMQLTNICRDVKEDLDRDRVYLPESVLGEVGTTQQEMIAGRADSAAIRRAVFILLSRAEERYREARAGMGYIPLRPRIAILVASRLYRQIGRRLLRVHGGDPMHGRTVLPGWERLLMVVLGLLDALDPRTWERR